MKTAAIVAAASALLLSGMAEAAEIKVLSTQATQEAYLELVAQFEKATGHKVATVFTGTLNVQKRLADGEAYDLIIDRKSTRLNSSHLVISYAVFCLKKKTLTKNMFLNHLYGGVVDAVVLILIFVLFLVSKKRLLRFGAARVSMNHHCPAARSCETHR